jgi:hypothetical protein
MKIEGIIRVNECLSACGELFPIVAARIAETVRNKNALSRQHERDGPSRSCRTSDMHSIDDDRSAGLHRSVV